MPSVDARADFLEGVYEAALDPERWSSVLASVSALMGGNSANLTFQDQVTGKGRALTFGSDPSLFDDYFGYFATRNPLLKITDFPLAPRVLTDEDKLPKDELVGGEYYNDFLKRMDAHSILMLRLSVENNNTTVLNVVRPANREPFGGRDIELAMGLHPHLVRAFGISARLFNMENRLAGLEQFADGSIHAVYIVDGGGKLFYTNRAGERLIARRVFGVRSGVFYACDRESAGKLSALIGTAAAGRELRSNGAMQLDRQGSISVTVTPVRGNPCYPLHMDNRVFICAVDQKRGVDVSAQRLRDLFGLTRAEAKIALQLLNGCDVRAAAGNLGLSYNTVRAHLGRIFGKTGTHRQIEFVRMMERAL